MEKDVIAQLTRDFIVDNFLFGQVGELHDSDSFLESGILDSTGILQLIAFLQDNCGITIDDEEVTPDNLDSIDRIVEFVLRKQDTGSAESPQVAAEGTRT